ncbi:MAG: 3-hydroxyacyl-ACP dehydratase FabZ [Kiritimatiellaeota bacterium]|nr:3-hydroxyacyl-ACP dehydratase FabZ [Kiritimatiellota bacterium]
MSEKKIQGERLVEDGQPYAGLLEDLLPHRKPFLFVDRLTYVGKEKFVGEAAYPASTWFFEGHFPSYPVVPGVILVETMAQCGGAGLIANGTVPRNGLFLLVGVDNAKFRRQVRPEELLRLEIETVKVGSRMIKQRGKAYVGDELACEADFTCILVPPK